MAQAHKHGAVLYAGHEHELAKSEQLTSENGLFKLVMQEDGNFVEYQNKKTPGTPDDAVWHSDTWRRGERACLQKDGRLVVRNCSGGTAWASSDKPLPVDCYKLVLQNDGNAVIYNGADLPVWSTHVKFKCLN